MLPGHRGRFPHPGDTALRVVPPPDQNKLWPFFYWHLPLSACRWFRTSWF